MPPSRHLPPPTACSPDLPRRSRVERMAAAHVASMGLTLADTMGTSSRQRLIWLGLLATPLLFPVALPGMASAVGVLCLWVAWGLCSGRWMALPRWLARRELGERSRVLLAKLSARTMRLIGRFARPRLLPLSDRPLRWLNGGMLAVAGVSMATPVPIISFDNVLPALAIVAMAWGLRLRDGWLVIVGYFATVLAAVSVLLWWWGGSLALKALLSLPAS